MQFSKGFKVFTGIAAIVILLGAATFIAINLNDPEETQTTEDASAMAMAIPGRPTSAGWSRWPRPSTPYCDYIDQKPNSAQYCCYASPTAWLEDQKISDTPKPLLAVDTKPTELDGSFSPEILAQLSGTPTTTKVICKRDSFSWNGCNPPGGGAPAESTAGYVSIEHNNTKSCIDKNTVACGLQIQLDTNIPGENLDHIVIFTGEEEDCVLNCWETGCSQGVYTCNSGLACQNNRCVNPDYPTSTTCEPLEVIETCGDNECNQSFETCDGSVDCVGGNLSTGECRPAGSASECTYCGDGIIQEGVEECDDGELNGTDQSSCTENCTLSQVQDEELSLYKTANLTCGSNSYVIDYTISLTNISNQSVSYNSITDSISGVNSSEVSNISTGGTYIDSSDGVDIIWPSGTIEATETIDFTYTVTLTQESAQALGSEIRNYVIVIHGDNELEFEHRQQLVCSLPRTDLKDDIMFVAAFLIIIMAVVIYKKKVGNYLLQEKLEYFIETSIFNKKRNRKIFEEEVLDRN